MLLTHLFHGLIFAYSITHALEQDLSTIRSWTKAGARFRARSITVSETARLAPTSTYLMKTISQQRNTKRAFLNPWLFQGCSDGHGLPSVVAPFSYQLDPSEVSGTSCQAFCDHRGDNLAATENGDLCWCGKKEDTALIFVDNSECSTPCAAEAGESCGGNNRLSVYTKAG